MREFCWSNLVLRVRKNWEKQGEPDLPAGRSSSRGAGFSAGLDGAFFFGRRRLSRSQNPFAFGGIELLDDASGVADDYRIGRQARDPYVILPGVSWAGMTLMLRRLLQPIWVLLAVVFLIEAWLWDHLEPVVAWVVAKIPLRAFKHWLAERVDTLSPAMTLVVFIVPVLPLFPLKLVGLSGCSPMNIG